MVAFVAFDSVSSVAVNAARFCGSFSSSSICLVSAGERAGAAAGLGATGGFSSAAAPWANTGDAAALQSRASAQSSNLMGGKLHVLRLRAILAVRGGAYASAAPHVPGMITVLAVLLAIAMLGVVVVLGLGMAGVVRGGDPRRSNALMRARVLLQGVALALMAAILLLRH